MSLPDAAIEALVDIFEDLVVSGIHALDPEERKKTVREAVQREGSKWAALDPGLVSARADAMTASRHVTPAGAAVPVPSGPTPDGGT